MPIPQINTSLCFLKYFGLKRVKKSKVQRMKLILTILLNSGNYSLEVVFINWPELEFWEVTTSRLNFSFILSVEQAGLPA